jgi:hypothetical protein
VTERFGHLETPLRLSILTERFGAMSHADEARGSISGRDFVFKRLEPEETITMVIKPNIVAIAAVVAALAIPSVASAAKVKQPLPTWDTCYSLAVERGSAPGRGGSEGNRGGGMGHYLRFMDECQAGKIPLGPTASAR